MNLQSIMTIGAWGWGFHFIIAFLLCNSKENIDGLIYKYKKRGLICQIHIFVHYINQQTK